VPVLHVPEGLDYEALRSCVREGLPAHVPAIGGRSIRLDLGARELGLFDLRRLLHLLRQEFSLDVTGLYVRPSAIHRFAERELKLKLFPVDPSLPITSQDLPTDAAGAPSDDEEPEEAVVPAEPAPAPPAPIVTLPNDLGADVVPALAAAAAAAGNAPITTPSPAPGRPEEGRRTHTVHRTLRSGTSIRFDGDVYVFGDVNPGAQVIATGNIVVLGALKGVGHAGAAGDEESFILAFDLRPTQLRIGRKIASMPARPASSAGPALPEKASVVGDQIILEVYRR
jgi:septum site-determining protein MinC